MTTPHSSNRYLIKFCSDVMDITVAASAELTALKADLELAARKADLLPEKSLLVWAQMLEDMSRMAAQMLEVVSWVLAQKAVQDEEISQGRAIAEFFPIAHEGILTFEPDPQSRSFPAGLEDVVHRSHKLYLRMARLKEEFRRTSASAPGTRSRAANIQSESEIDRPNSGLRIITGR